MKRPPPPVTPVVGPADSKRLLGFLAAVFLVKLIVVLQLHGHPLLQPDAGLDTSAYVALAGRVRGGDLLLGAGLYFVSPLYIYFLAVALAIVDSFTAIRVLQVLLGTAAVGFVFVAAREWFGRRAAWMAAIAAAATGAFTFYEVLLLQAALDPFLTATALGALALALGRRPFARPCRPGEPGRSSPPSPASEVPTTSPEGGRRWFFVAGLALGLQILNRPNTLVPAVVFVVLLFAIRRARGALLLAGGLALALAPFAARNAIAAGTWSPLSSHGGLNLYIGNNPEADGTYRMVPGITPNIAGQEADARRVASDAVGHPVNDDEASAYFVRKSIEWMRAEPGAALRLFLRKLAYTFNAAHIPLNDSYAFYAYDVRTLLAGLAAGAWALIPLGLVGLVVGRPREQLRPYMVWLSFVPAYAVSVAVFFVSDRYRMPLLVPMCIGAGAAIDRLAAGVKRSRAAALVRTEYVALAALFVFVNWPLGLDDGRAEERTRMAEESAAEGRPDLADFWAGKAEAGSPHPALVHFRVGRALLAQHDPAGAVRHLERARLLDPGRAETEYALGQALLDGGRPREAVPHLQEAVKAGVRPDVAGFDLARALAASGERRAAVDALARVTPANPRDAWSWLALGDLAVQLDARPLEERFFVGAISADPSNATAHLNLAVAYAQQGRADDARRHAGEAVRLKPDYEKARQLLAALGASSR